MLEYPFDPDSLFADPEMARARRALAERWRAEGYHDDATLPSLLGAAAAERPDFEIVLHSVESPGNLTLRQLECDARRAASAFHGLGLRKGDVVAVQLPNRAETAVAYCALAMLGVVFVPIVHIYGARETDWILRASGARKFLCPDRWGSIDFGERLAAMSGVALGDVVIVGEHGPDATTSWSELMASAGDDPLPEGPDPGDPLLVVYTSGTTADPKGVVHTHRTLLFEMRNTTQLPTDEPRPVALQPWPAGHIGGLIALLGPIVTPMRCVILDRWDPEAAADLIARHRVTMVNGTPFHVAAMLDRVEAGDPRLASVNEVASGGAGVPPSIVERADRSGWSMRRSYGSSEHPSLTAGTRFGPLAARANTDGVVSRGSALRIVDAEGRDVAPGEPGEIWCIGPEQCLGYTDPQRNAEAFAPGGWFRTGDVGVLDRDGNLTITDRVKDIIIRGGENLSSLEIEDLLQRHPAIAEAAAVGMPDARYGERVCAFVVVADGAAAPGVEELLAHVVALGAAKQKAPERVVAVDDLPRTAAGKVRKADLRARLAEG